MQKLLVLDPNTRGPESHFRHSACWYAAVLKISNMLNTMQEWAFSSSSTHETLSRMRTTPADSTAEPTPADTHPHESLGG